MQNMDFKRSKMKICNLIGKRNTTLNRNINQIK